MYRLVYISAAFYQLSDTLETAVTPRSPRSLPRWSYQRYCATYIRYYSIIEHPRDIHRYPRGTLFSRRWCCESFLTYSSRIYLDPWKPWDRTAPSRYFPFYDSSTYDAFKPASGEIGRTSRRISFRSLRFLDWNFFGIGIVRHFLAVSRHYVVVNYVPSKWIRKIVRDVNMPVFYEHNLHDWL